MNLLVALLLLQSAVLLPARVSMENPAEIEPVPDGLRKDYDRIWTRFLTGREDAKVLEDGAKLLRRNPEFDPALIVQAYVHMYAGRMDAARGALETVLTRKPSHPLALYYLAEIAFSRKDYAQSSDLYLRLMEAGSTRADLETKRQRALLLAAEDLLRRAAALESASRFGEAESLYREALDIAPAEPVFHAQLGAVLARQEKWDEALIHFRRQVELDTYDENAHRQMAEVLMHMGRTEEAREVLDRLRESGAGDEELEQKVADLEDLGRWGDDIERFHDIRDGSAINREQLSAVIVRYFPQILEFRQAPRIVTDIYDSWANPEIQTVVGIGLLEPLPNHTFQPSRVVTRAEFAVALARLTRLLGVNPAAPLPESAPDVDSRNPLRADIDVVLGLGLLVPDSNGNFDPAGRVSGEDAVGAVERLLGLMRAASI